RDASFYASPMTRCQLTARHFAEGMGFDKPLVQDADELGVHGFYYEDSRAVQKLMQAQGYMAFMLEYLRKGIAPHSRPVKQATEELAQWLQRQTAALLGVYVSHDIFVAAFLTGLNAAHLTAENWVGFLHGAVLSETPDGEWTCSPFVPEFSTVSPEKK
ncbi:MAG: histidine phosphatase family protein, partial [Kiritimatiellae bacterium]|nr:histidine phosphatase family protein [Kiritimatiellia bacterium]